MENVLQLIVDGGMNRYAYSDNDPINKSDENGHAGGEPESQHLKHLVTDIQQRIKGFANEKPTENYRKESWANAKGVAKDLQSYSNILGNAAKAGDIKVSSALYDLQTGKVDFE